MKRLRLGVNIDHVATIRNARGEKYPDPLNAALICQSSGADSITIHLREDRRHIKDFDLKNILKNISIPVNLEIAPTKEMLKIAIKNKPDYVCIVPEKRFEITTEGGLNLNKNMKFIQKMITQLSKNNIRVSLFIEPKVSAVKKTKKLGANCIEIHTGKFCNSQNFKKKRLEFYKIKKAAILANKLNLEVHAGHGLTYKTAKEISKLKEIVELNIGHFIISESIFLGLKNSIYKFKKIIKR
jgi:pyridoxine 5-phosphate synthase